MRRVSLLQSSHPSRKDPYYRRGLLGRCTRTLRPIWTGARQMLCKQVLRENSCFRSLAARHGTRRPHMLPLSRTRLIEWNWRMGRSCHGLSKTTSKADHAPAPRRHSRASNCIRCCRRRKEGYLENNYGRPRQRLALQPDQCRGGREGVLVCRPRRCWEYSLSEEGVQALTQVVLVLQIYKGNHLRSHGFQLLWCLRIVYTWCGIAEIFFYVVRIMYAYW